jgi:uncharacterized protein (UPF0128 family)
MELGVTARSPARLKSKARLACELNLWKGKALLEANLRQKAEQEVIQLKARTREAQSDNQRLEEYIQDWKSVAVQSRMSVSKYCEGIRRLLEELKTELL